MLSPLQKCGSEGCLVECDFLSWHRRTLCRRPESCEVSEPLSDHEGQKPREAVSPKHPLRGSGCDPRPPTSSARPWWILAIPQRGAFGPKLGTKYSGNRGGQNRKWMELAVPKIFEERAMPEGK
ncbi:hypothetical protein JRQ81_003519, partial [Phrynocephalus forsythii]